VRASLHGRRPNLVFYQYSRKRGLNFEQWVIGEKSRVSLRTHYPVARLGLAVVEKYAEKKRETNSTKSLPLLDPVSSRAADTH
jgi:hypothetical protein